MIGKHRLLTAVAIAGAVACFAACGSSGGGNSSAPPPQTTPAAATQPSDATSAPVSTPPPAPPTSAAPVPDVVSITAHDSASSMSFEISGTPRPGLVAVTFANKGKYTHEMFMSMMKPGVSLAQLKAALAKGGPEKASTLLIDPDRAYPVPSMLGPGRTETVTTTLAAGHYVVVCFLPGPDGMPHAAMGMIDEMTVDGTDAGAAAPAPKGTVELTDSGITVPAGFGGGGTFEIKNTGTRLHDFSVVRLRGASLPSMFGCVGTAMDKGTVVDKCPGVLVAGIQDLEPGQSAYLSVTLPAGPYSYLSTEGEGADVKAGLVGSFTVG